MTSEDANEDGWPRSYPPGAVLAQHCTRAGLRAIPCVRLAEVGMLMLHHVEQRGSKVPEVTLVFWIIKIAATTLGETFGDTVTMTLNWGYLVGTAIFFSLLVALVVWQIAVRSSEVPVRFLYNFDARDASARELHLSLPQLDRCN
jgi:hypothetical protein